VTTTVPPTDVGDYRRAMARFATGVTIVTTLAGEHHHAMTANALCSVSLEPLLMLVSVERDARFHDAVLESQVWGVSVLPAEARSTADWFATRGRPLHGQLDRVPHWIAPVTGVAWLDGALSNFECRTTDVHPAGDHSIVVGEVASVHVPDHLGKALIYYRGRYEALT
jgi:flavin reductase (DIM6/NTAB) family NADH-FMN oxidoreductase RutF